MTNGSFFVLRRCLIYYSLFKNSFLSEECWASPFKGTRALITIGSEEKMNRHSFLALLYIFVPSAFSNFHFENSLKTLSALLVMKGVGARSMLKCFVTVYLGRRRRNGFLAKSFMS